MFGFLGGILSILLKLFGAQKPQQVQEGEALGASRAVGAQQATGAKVAQAVAQAEVDAPTTETQLEDRLSKGTF